VSRRGLAVSPEAGGRPSLRPYRNSRHGNINKIKMIKRQMYGRAAFPLLRKRFILHPG